MKKLLFLQLFLIGFFISVDAEISYEEKTIRVQNSLFWGAFGDAFGAPVEFIESVSEILKTNGYEVDFLADNYNKVMFAVKNYYKKMNCNFHYTPYTDDTRMTILVLQTLHNIHHGALLKQFVTTETKDRDLFLAIARLFKKDSFDKRTGWLAHFRMPGISTMNVITGWPLKIATVSEIFLPQLTFEKVENDKVGGGCGSVMHAAPFGYFKGYAKFAGQHSMLTHNHPIAIASCASLAYGIHGMIYEKKTKEESIALMIDIAEQYEKECSSSGYQLRMRSILETAVCAAAKMVELRAKIVSKESNPHCISFHELVKNEEFLVMHSMLFPKHRSKDYGYETAEFHGWDAATCLAAAIYNFIVWIPKNINDLPKKDRIRCLTNAITSAIVTGGDSDSIASVTGQLCGAYVAEPSVSLFLKSAIEDGDLIDKYATSI